MKPEFWTRLRDFTSYDVFNPWADQDALDILPNAPAARRGRLAHHFNRDAKYLLIGEAPGYRGCHFSGVPFTCEKQLCDGIVPGISAHSRFTSRKLPWSEGSATIIWSTLRQLGIAADVVLWNAFAFHPHKVGEMHSNRAPTTHELLCGMDILATVVESFPGSKLIAVGKTAAKTLDNLNFRIDHEVRHPSMGGANLFSAQMQELAA